MPRTAVARERVIAIADGDLDAALSVLKAEIEACRKQWKDETARASVRAIAKARANTLTRARNALRTMRDA